MLDVRGALDALPALPLDDKATEGEAVLATGTGGIPDKVVHLVAPTVAPTADNQGTTRSLAGNPTSGDVPSTLAVSGCDVNEKGRLSSPDNRPACRGDWIRTSDLLNPIQAR